MIKALKKPLLLAGAIFFTANFSYAATIIETENFVLSLESYLRQDLVTFKNVMDLDSSQSDDTTAYLGIDYSLAFLLNCNDDRQKFYLKLEMNGPYDYNAPLFIHNTLKTSSGTIEKYRNEDLLPQVEEFWLDTVLRDNYRFKIGLYTYEVGNGFSLNGAYENYGLTITREEKGFIWRAYYCRPDLVYKNRLGPHIQQEQGEDIVYNTNAANFFATDLKLNKGNTSFHPYVGVLTDYTSVDKRNNYFTAAIKRDILGTVGCALSLKQDSLSLDLEAAHNFGKAESSNPEYKDVYHTGYLLYTDINYGLGKLKPSLQFVLGSGNKLTLEMAENQDTTLTSGKNRAFSSYSPLNNYLGDSISGSHSDIRPIVAMGAGYGLNYGVARPGTFCSSDFDNIIITSLGFDYNVTEKLCIGLYGYYLRASEKGIGLLNQEAKYLSGDLGNEIDLFLDYNLSQNILISFLGGYFFPGKYYKEEREDTQGSLFSPFVRGDGFADCAYQVELAVEVKF